MTVIDLFLNLLLIYGDRCLRLLSNVLEELKNNNLQGTRYKNMSWLIN